MRLGMNHAPGAGSITRLVCLLSSVLPLCYGCPLLQTQGNGMMEISLTDTCLRRLLKLKQKKRYQTRTLNIEKEFMLNLNSADKERRKSKESNIKLQAIEKQVQRIYKCKESFTSCRTYILQAVGKKVQKFLAFTGKVRA